MRILFVNYEYPPLGGGGGVVMAALARHLAKRHDVTVLTSRGHGQPADTVEDGVRVVRVPVLFRRQQAVANLPSMLAFVFNGLAKGISLMRHGQYDVINTHFVLPTGPVGHLLSKFYGIPNVLSAHGGDLYDPSKKMSPHRHLPLRAAVRLLIKGADVLVGQSRDTLDRVTTIYGIRRPTELVPLGIERPVLPPAPVSRDEFSLPADAFVMVTVGRLVARKTTGLLVKAMAASALAGAHLVIVGSGPETEELTRLAERLGLRDRVHLTGAVSDEKKYRLLSVADVFVSASQHEGFGLVFLEAMACSLPVISFDRGGQVDFLRNGRTGKVVALNNLDGLTRAMIELHDHPADRRQMGAFNRELAENFFIDSCANAYERIFTDAVDPASRYRSGVDAPKTREARTL